MKNNYYIPVWHKNGIGDVTNLDYSKIRVYKNGKLANTRGKFEHIIITLEN